MKTSWIKGEVEPTEQGKYYVITEVQKDTALYKKGDIVIDYDWYSKALGWMSIKDNGSTWKVLAWAEILLPDAPEEVKNRLVTYFDVEVAKRRNKKMTSIEILARAKLLSMATAIVEQYGEQESDWDMLHIWRAFEHGELNDCLSGILRIDARKAAQTVHAAPYGCKVDALIDCASKTRRNKK